MLIVAQILDPVRIALVLLAFWLVPKLYDQGSRWIPNLIAMMAISVIVAVVLASTQAISWQTDQWIIAIIFGFVSNCAIWAIVYGLRGAVRKIAEN